MTLPRALPVLLALAFAIPASAAEPPESEIHGLRQLARRGRVRPFGLVTPVMGIWPSERVVFRDTVTGTTVWRISGNPGSNRHDAAQSPWNADGSLLALSGMRGDRGGTWLASADGSGWRWFGWAWHAWSADDPKIAFVVAPDTQELQKVDAYSGDKTAVWKVPFARPVFAPPHPDGRSLLLVETPPDRSSSTAWIIDLTGQEEPRRFPLPEAINEAWFLKRPDNAFAVSYERRDRDGTFLCEPSKDGAIRALDPLRFQSAVPSPSGKFIAYIRRDLMLFDVAKGESRAVSRLSTDRVRVSWNCDDAWFVASLANQIATIATDSGKIDPICVPNSQLGYGGWNTETHPVTSPDGTKVGFASTMLGDIDFYIAVRHLPDPPREVVRKGKELSWKAPARCRELAGYRVWRDGKPLTRELTKETTCQVEMGGTYAVTAVEHSGLESEHADTTAPRAPTGVKAEPLDAWTLSIAWEAVADLDVSYYNVYCGPGAEKRAASARVASTVNARHLEWGLAAGSEYPVTVTAVDGAGNESPASPVVKVRTPRAPALLKLIPVNKNAPAEIAVDLPEAADVIIWVSLRQLRAGPAPPLRFVVDAAQPRDWWARWDLVGGLGPGVAIPAFWDLLPGPAGVSPMRTLSAGHHTLTINCAAGSVEIASVIVTADRSFVPEGISSFFARKPK